MRPSLRFLAVAVIGWAGVRAATLGMIPGAEVFAAKTAAKPEAGRVEQAIEPIAPAASTTPPPYAEAFAYQNPYGYPYQNAAMPYPPGWAGPAQPIVVPIQYVYRGAPAAAAPQQAVWKLPEPRRQLYSPADGPGDWSVSRMAMAALPPSSPASEPMQSTAPAIIAQKLDRARLTMWAMLRGRQDLTGATSLASGGTLGGSQAGARLFYYFTPGISAVVRSSSEVNRRGGEVAAGVRVQPLRSIPVWLTAERRQRLGKFGGGRSAFALFAETGVYDRPMPWGFTLDGYAQAGIVGVKSRDLFADGGATFVRPVYRQFSSGFGVWGGIQPGLYRVDAGPRVTMKVRRNVRVHVDWRQRLAGNAEPGSGPVLTLAGDF